MVSGGVEGFSASADFCYLIKPSYTVQNIAQIRASAEFLGMADVLESTKKYLYTNVFAHWRASVAFLHQYQRLNSPVDEYVETRCLKVVVAALARAFGETKYLSAPMPLTAVTAGNWQSSPCQALTEILVRTASWPDVYASESMDALVDADVNLHIKCRQGRNVRSWLDSVIENDCPTDRARCWVTLCLSRMLLKGAPECQPWMELSSQYWCSLLEHVDHLEAVVDEDMQVAPLPWTFLDKFLFTTTMSLLTFRFSSLCFSKQFQETIFFDSTFPIIQQLSRFWVRRSHSAQTDSTVHSTKCSESLPT